jgi:hypothetical protein
MDPWTHFLLALAAGLPALLAALAAFIQSLRNGSKVAQIHQAVLPPETRQP